MLEMIRRNKKFRSIKKHWQLYVILFIPFLFVIVFSYVPMYGLLLAFKNFVATKGILGSPWVGLQHFEYFFSSAMFSRIVGNTIILQLLGMIFGVPIPILLAISLNATKNKLYKKTVQMVTYLPYFISTVVMVGMIIQFLSLKHGVINNLMEFLGFERIDFVSKSMYFRFIYIFTNIWQGAGFSSIIYIAVLSSIDPTLYEAATIDGATKFKKVWHIDIPSLMPTIITLFILNAGQIMNVGFEKIYLMKNPLNSQVTEVISTYIYQIGLVSSDYGYSTAVGLFNSVINMILLVGVNKAARTVGESSLW